MGPIIGITMTTRNWTANYYAKSVANAGGAPVILPIEGGGNIQPVLSKLDGIIFTGGTDINPYYYKEEPKYGLGEIKPYRDEHEFWLLNEVMEKYDYPVLGVCRGMQVLNVFFGGSMYQCLEKEQPGGLKHALKDIYPLEFPAHRVSINKESKLFDLVGKEELFVNSLHHQAVKDVGKDLTAVSKANDGVIEALELTGDRFIAGVQWHPELMSEKCEDAKQIFSSFINLCTAADNIQIASH